MAKRKTRKKAPPPKLVVEPLDTQFACVFCNHEKSCDVTLDKKSQIGKLRCRVCFETYQTRIHHLTQEIDVYGEWIDECERVNS